MIYQFGYKSRENLKTVEGALQIVIEEALEVGLIDFSVIEGHRNKKKQNQYYKDGRSKVRWPSGKHNKIPSEAVDAVPYVNDELSWKPEHCIFLAGIILACAKMQEINIRWGGNWDMDSEPVTDQDFDDLVHYEIMEVK